MSTSTSTCAHARTSTGQRGAWELAIVVPRDHDRRSGRISCEMESAQVSGVNEFPCVRQHAWRRASRAVVV